MSLIIRTEYTSCTTHRIKQFSINCSKNSFSGKFLKFLDDRVTEFLSYLDSYLLIVILIVIF